MLELSPELVKVMLNAGLSAVFALVIFYWYSSRTKEQVKNEDILSGERPYGVFPLPLLEEKIFIIVYSYWGEHIIVDYTDNFDNAEKLVNKYNSELPEDKEGIYDIYRCIKGSGKSSLIMIAEDGGKVNNV